MKEAGAKDFVSTSFLELNVESSSKEIIMTFELSEAKKQLAEMQKAIDGFRRSL
jgi:hypothetical protein